MKGSAKGLLVAHAVLDNDHGGPLLVDTGLYLRRHTALVNGLVRAHDVVKLLPRLSRGLDHCSTSTLFFDSNAMLV